MTWTPVPNGGENGITGSFFCEPNRINRPIDEEAALCGEDVAN
jgi:hypothetical protein